MLLFYILKFLLFTTRNLKNDIEQIAPTLIINYARIYIQILISWCERREKLVREKLKYFFLSLALEQIAVKID